MKEPEAADRRTDMDRQRLAGEAVEVNANRTGDARDAVHGEVGSAHLAEPSELEAADHDVDAAAVDPGKPSNPGRP
jgi:hypothetical protein